MVQNGPKMVQKWFKMVQNGSKVDPKMIKKWSKKDYKMGQIRQKSKRNAAT